MSRRKSRAKDITGQQANDEMVDGHWSGESGGWWKSSRERASLTMEGGGACVLPLSTLAIAAWPLDGLGRLETRARAFELGRRAKARFNLCANPRRALVKRPRCCQRHCR